MSEETRNTISDAEKSSVTDDPILRIGDLEAAKGRAPVTQYVLDDPLNVATDNYVVK